jgi:O-antigen biosynthesis protein
MHEHGTFDRWRSYLDGVEPALLSRPRVHRFAQVPELGPPALQAAPIAVWIEGEGGSASRTRDALAGGTVRPAGLLGGSLEDALVRTRCEYLALVRAGDSPAPLALERLGQAASLAPDAGVITCDDDVIDRAGARSAPRLRPGPSPDRWLACDDSGALIVVRRNQAAAALGELHGGPGWRHELALVLAGPDGSGHAHVPMLLCHRELDLPHPPPLDAWVVSRYSGGASVEWAQGVRRVRRAIAGEPSVEVVICFRDQPALLARCVVSLLGRTRYERLSVALVDNGSRDSQTAALLDGLAPRPRVRVLRDERAFNFAALNNRAAESSIADVLVFLNNDTEIVDGGWVEALLEEALRPEVGAVAPLLLYPGGAVQHAGAAIGLHGYAGHPFAGLMPEDETVFGRAAGGTRNWLAVTAACMMVERAKFEAVGAFDEGFVVGGNDVDLCLRLTAAGHRSLCVPHAVVMHDESVSRGAHIDPGDFVRSEQSYGEFRTVGDPFYSPSLTLESTGCELRLPSEGAP